MGPQGGAAAEKMTGGAAAAGVTDSAQQFLKRENVRLQVGCHFICTAVECFCVTDEFLTALNVVYSVMLSLRVLCWGATRAATKTTPNVNAKALVSELRTASPSVARLTDLAVWREREAFEEKQGRALVLLRKKDAKIRELGEAAARHNNNISRQRAADGRSKAAVAAVARSGGTGVTGGRYGGGGGRGNRECDNTAATPAAVVQRLEECVEEQADQIEALLEEVMKRGVRLSI